MKLILTILLVATIPYPLFFSFLNPLIWWSLLPVLLNIAPFQVSPFFQKKLIEDPYIPTVSSLNSIDLPMLLKCLISTSYFTFVLALSLDNLTWRGSFETASNTLYQWQKSWFDLLTQAQNSNHNTYICTMLLKGLDKTKSDRLLIWW
jgi:hypothetical protein